MHQVEPQPPQKPPPVPEETSKAPRPWAEPPAVTILQARKTLTKRYVGSPDEKVTREDYGNAKYFDAWHEHINSIERLCEVLVSLKQKRKHCIIRGSRKAGVSAREIRRTKALFEEVDRCWICWDLDKVRLPFDVDPSNKDDLQRAARYLRDQLPEPWRSAACVVDFSSSAFIEVDEEGQFQIDPCKAKAHLWFLLNSPVCDDALRAYANATNEAAGFELLDPATCDAIQIHYTAEPIFEGMADPLAERVFLLEGAPAVEVSACQPGLYDGEEARRRREEADRQQAEARRQREEKRRQQQALGFVQDDLKERIEARVSTLDVFRQKLGYPKEEQKGHELHLRGHGGLHVAPDTGKWCCNSTGEGGHLFEAYCWCEHGNTNVPKGPEFRAFLEDMAREFGIDVPERPKRTPRGEEGGSNTPSVPDFSNEELREKIEAIDPEQDHLKQLYNLEPVFDCLTKRRRSEQDLFLEIIKAHTKITLQILRKELKAAQARCTQQKARKKKASDGRPTCVLPSGLEPTSREVVVMADRLNKPPVMFVRGREVLRLVRSRGKMDLVPYDGISLVAHLSERIRFQQKVKDEDGNTVLVDKDLPVYVCQNILERSTWPFPVAEEIIRHPVLAPRGDLVTRTGYREDLQAYVDLGDLEINVPHSPTPEQIQAAKNLILEELICDFPFIDQSSVAHAVALGVVPHVRPLIKEAVPPHLVTATAARTGKSKLITVLATVSTGENFKLLAPADSEEEWRKRITALLQGSPTIVCIDNVNKRLNSASLAAVFTSPTWTDRILGHSKEKTFLNRAIWTITANNPQASEELTKRCVWIGMDAKVENPEDRTGFKHPRIIQWAKQQRVPLMEAFLTLATAWNAKGRPSGKGTLGGFEEWADIIGGILEVAEIPGFLENSKNLVARTSTQSQEWKQFIGVWWDTKKDAVLKVSQLRELAAEAELLGAVMGDKSEKSQEIRLGRALTQRQDRVFELDNTVICVNKTTDNHTKTNGWTLAMVGGKL